MGFLAAGFLAAFLAATFLGFFAFGFLTFLAFFSTAASLYEPAPFLPAAAAASTLLLATTALRMAWREDPFLSPSPLMAAAIMVAYGGWAAAPLGLVAFLTA